MQTEPLGLLLFDTPYSEIISSLGMLFAYYIIEEMNMTEIQIETDPLRRQEIQNSIQEGETIMRSGKYHGRKMTKEEAFMIQKSIDNAKVKLGL